MSPKKTVHAAGPFSPTPNFYMVGTLAIGGRNIGGGRDYPAVPPACTGFAASVQTWQLQSILGAPRLQGSRFRFSQGTGMCQNKSQSSK